MRRFRFHLLSALTVRAARSVRAIPVALSVLTAATSCTSLEQADPYDGRLSTLTVQLGYAAGYESCLREGILLRVEEIDRGGCYEMRTDAAGAGSMALPDGNYRVTVSDRADGWIFNGLADRIRLNRPLRIDLPVTVSKAGSLVIKEIYCGGCLCTPEEGRYQSDKYFIIHNNDCERRFLDGLCFGVLDPYNAQAANVWVKTDPVTGAALYPDFVPLAQAVWQFGGGGGDFPIEAGADAVVCCGGAIDHAAQYPLSVDLNREEYFVCYNPTCFPNPLYHPVPGDRIRRDHWLDVAIKTGQANAFVFSVFSPAVVLFRAEGMPVREFLAREGSVITKPGSPADRVVCVPAAWVVDGVEVFYGGSSSNLKRLPPSVDAGYVVQSETFAGRSLHRRVDEEATAAAGYEVLCDTNNASADFYERAKPSLHE